MTLVYCEGLGLIDVESYRVDDAFVVCEMAKVATVSVKLILNNHSVGFMVII